MNREVLKKSLEKFTLMKKRAGFSELELDTFQAGEATKTNYNSWNGRKIVQEITFLHYHINAYGFPLFYFSF